MHVTWAPHLDGSDAAAYDRFVLASPAGHARQTRAWAEVARAGGHVTTRFALVRDAGKEVGAALVLRPAVAGVPLPWASIERGPVVARAADAGVVARAIAREARRHGIARLRVMPYWDDQDALRAEASLRAAAFHDVQRFDGAHACTLRIAVGGKSDAELFAGKSKQQVRWRTKQAQEAGARARRATADDWRLLRALHGAMMRAQGKRDRPAAWWSALQRHVADETHGAMFACDFEGRLVAACVVLRHGELATYAWGASVPDKLPFSKAIPPLVAAIRWARDVGCVRFDLGGLPLEEDRDPKRNAIATFKLDFDKTRVRLVREHATWC
jgi:lipid II:glycine glycyltransferase (peptidoglycan interpeptide bridge formation enzyme)